MLTRRTAVIAAAAASAQAAPNTPNAEYEEVLQLLDAQPHVRAGGPGELALAQFVRSRLDGFGFKTQAQTIMAPYFEPRQSALIWPGGTCEIAPQAIVRATGPAGISAALRLWRDQSDSPAISGAIAVVLLPFARHSQVLGGAVKPILRDVLAAGPRAIVLITDGPTGETIYLNAPFKESDMPTIPIATLGPKPGAAVIAAAMTKTEGRYVVDGEGGRRACENIWGLIDRGGPLLVVSTPRSGWTPAVAERGPGLATFLALARWAPRALPRQSLMFVSTTAHEYDNGGSHAFFEDHAPPRENVALWVHLGAGFAARDAQEYGRHRLLPLPSVDPQRFLMASEALVPRLKTAFAGQPGLEAVHSTSLGAQGELAEVVQRNYAPAFGFVGAHRYHHVMSDRLDKVHVGAIGPVVASVKGVITSLLR